MDLLGKPAAAQHAERGGGLGCERGVQGRDAAALLQAQPSDALPCALQRSSMSCYSCSNAKLQ